MAKLEVSTRIAVFVRDRGECVYCGDTYQNGARLSVDHVQSRKRGGSDAFANLVTACIPCNKDKAHFGLKAYLVELEDQGKSIAGIAGRVEAACAKPIDWKAVRLAAEELKRQAKMMEDDDDD